MNIRNLYLIFGFTIAISALLFTAPPAGASARLPQTAQNKIPAAALVKSDGTLDLQKGVNGSLDLAGWNVTLDSERGPVLAPQARARDPQRGPGLTPPAATDDNDWFGFQNGVNDSVYAIAVSGSTVYVGGAFTRVCGNTACDTNNVRVNHIARWNGTQWSALGFGVDLPVYTIVAAGDSLFVGGAFSYLCGNATCDSNTTRVNHVAYWNGSNWLGLGFGVSGVVYTLTAGDSLYAGGNFHWICSNAACGIGAYANNIARFTGSGWVSLGNGLDSNVYALAYTNGALYVGGLFSKTCKNSNCDGLLTVNYIAKWNGSQWSALSHGLNHIVRALAVSNNNLYVGGNFDAWCGYDWCTTNNVRVNHVVGWNLPNANWFALGSGVNGTVNALSMNGSELYIGGDFTALCGNTNCNNANVAANRIAKWNGSQWSALGSGVNNYALAVAWSGSYLLAGGNFTAACGNAICTGNTPVNYFAKYGPDCTGRPAAPSLLAPATSTQLTKPKVAMDWNDVPCATKYKVRVKQDSKQGTVVFKKALTASNVQTTALAKGHTYYWFVKACNDQNQCAKSAWGTFTLK